MSPPHPQIQERCLVVSDLNEMLPAQLRGDNSFLKELKLVDDHYKLKNRDFARGFGPRDLIIDLEHTKAIKGYLEDSHHVLCKAWMAMKALPKSSGSTPEVESKH